MNINGKNLSEFNGELIGRVISTAALTTQVEWLRQGLSPLYVDQYTTFKKIDISVEIKTPNAQELEEKKSALATELERCSIKFHDIDYDYDCYLVSFDPSYVTTTWNDINISLLGVCTDKEVTLTLSKALSQTIDVKGNTKTPCTYEIRPTTSIIDLEINGIKVHTVPINSILIIDGEQCLITLNGANKFMDTELDEFPYLYPGVNTININNTNCEVKIKYKPRFV